MKGSYLRSRLELVIAALAVVLLSATSSQCVSEQVLYSFNVLPHGASPQASLIADAAGNLYGTAYYGDELGVVFELSLNSNGKWSESVLYRFTGDPPGVGPNNPVHGAYPQGSLIFDAAGNLYGTTSGGGRYGIGTVFELSPTSNGWQQTVLWSFSGTPDGANPSGGLIFDQAGNLYGTTENGGYNYCNCGIAFELSPAADGTWTENNLYTFVGFTGNGSDGARPRSALTFDQKGNLYGTTENGGYRSGSCKGNNQNGYGFGCGTVFELSPQQSGWSETVLYSFTANNDGANPTGTVVLDQEGNLYGTTSGGLAGNGSVFRLARRSWAEKTLYLFPKYREGQYPWSGVVFDAAGNLYGTTQYGGHSKCLRGCGTIYELSPAERGHWTETLLYAFEGRRDGGHPLGGLLMDSSGDLYATASSGREGCQPNCGAILKVMQRSGGRWRPSVLYDFPSKTDGAFAYSNLIADSSGNLYGTTEYGGDTACNYPLGCGTVFKVTQHRDGGWTREVLHSFNCNNNKDGAYPAAGLVFDSAGILYGTAPFGGPHGCGTYSQMGGVVFALSPLPDGNWKETIVYTFQNSGDGDGPTGGLVFGKDGKLYGTTIFGGSYRSGTVFQLTPVRHGEWKEVILYNFQGFQAGDGSAPVAALTFDDQGDLYGTTLGGGIVYIYGGIVFKLTHPRSQGGTWNEKVLYEFRNGDDGANPTCALVLDLRGILYGTATQGGAYNAGVVFKVRRGVNDTWTESTLHSFVGVNGDGAYPYGSMVFDGAGNLYGTTSIGGTNGGGCGYGNGCGTVFELTPGSGGEWTETVLQRFTGGIDGGEPYAGLLFDQAGSLYGTTRLGGTAEQGAVFALKLQDHSTNPGNRSAQPRVRRNQ